MSIIEFNPLALIEGTGVSVVEAKGAYNDSPAMVVKQGLNFTIKLNIAGCEGLYLQSWVRKYATFDEFKKGVMLHEVAHIRYKTFCSAHDRTHSMPQFSNSLFHHIDNILEDTRIEYCMSIDSPMCASYIQTVLMSVKRMMKRTDGKPIPDLLDRLIRTLFSITRFSVIPKDADPEFVEILTPLVLAIRRGTRENALYGSRIVYLYIMRRLKDAGVEPDFVEVLSEFVIGIGTEEIESTLESEATGTSSVKAAAEAKRKGATKPTNQLVLGPVGSTFYRQTIEKRKSLIVGLREVFKRHFTRVEFTPAYDGDLSVKRQQNAYLHSFTGEPSRDYLRPDLRKAEFDIAVLRDISGSTSSMSEPYAEAIICVLASLFGLPHVRTAAIDFSDAARVVKHFNERIEEVLIEPTSTGGTGLLNALKEAERFTWQSRRRYMLIVTDGEVYDKASCNAKIAELRDKAQVRSVMISVERDIGLIEGSDGALIRCSLERLPEVIMKALVKGV